MLRCCRPTIALRIPTAFWDMYGCVMICWAWHTLTPGTASRNREPLGRQNSAWLCTMVWKIATDASWRRGVKLWIPPPKLWELARWTEVPDWDVSSKILYKILYMIPYMILYMILYVSIICCPFANGQQHNVTLATRSLEHCSFLFTVSDWALWPVDGFCSSFKNGSWKKKSCWVVRQERQASKPSKHFYTSEAVHFPRSAFSDAGCTESPAPKISRLRAMDGYGWLWMAMGDLLTLCVRGWYLERMRLINGYGCNKSRALPLTP